ncbi:PREDICTED: protein giant [Bactrocera latifrons]|uniref:Protein giant n=1 Tax=Bactrocera latifrons TaxID=174628 RepID=A0A0K8UID0_BACLA|nr:PREDICTED: protein giant [Bactrocera latifrons]
MMIQEKLISGQFLFDLKNEHNNLLHSATAQHARLSAHQSFLSHSQAFNHSLPLTQHALHQTHGALPAATIEQLELYSAYAYQQQAQLIGSTAQAECASRHQSASEVLDLSRRDSVETASVRKTPSPYHTNSSIDAESPAGSPIHSQHQQQLLQPNLLYNAQQQMGRLAPPLASFYPAFYSSIGLAKEATAATTPPLAAAVTPPASNASLYTAHTQASPISNNSLAVATAVAAAAAAASTTPNSMLHNLKTEADVHMTPLSPSSSHDGRSKSPAMQLANVAPNNPTTPNSSSALNPLKSTRPFKAFPRDPLVIAANFAATDVLLDNPRVERYTEYRKRVLEQIHNSNGGARTITNPKMRRMNSRRNSNTSSNAPEGASSEGEERHGAGADESSDCDSSYTGGQADKVSSSAHANNGEENNNIGAGNSSSSAGGQVKDAAYYERRRKNNAAAKKSRDRRRIKEDEIAIRAAYLERQNIELLCQIDALKAQLAAFTSKAVSA